MHKAHHRSRAPNGGVPRPRGVRSILEHMGKRAKNSASTTITSSATTVSEQVSKHMSERSPSTALHKLLSIACESTESLVSHLETEAAQRMSLDARERIINMFLLLEPRRDHAASSSVEQEQQQPMNTTPPSPSRALSQYHELQRKVASLGLSKLQQLFTVLTTARPQEQQEQHQHHHHLDSLRADTLGGHETVSSRTVSTLLRCLSESQIADLLQQVGEQWSTARQVHNDIDQQRQQQQQLLSQDSLSFYARSDAVSLAAARSNIVPCATPLALLVARHLCSLPIWPSIESRPHAYLRPTLGGGSGSPFASIHFMLATSCTPERILRSLYRDTARFCSSVISFIGLDLDSLLLDTITAIDAEQWTPATPPDAVNHGATTDMELEGDLYDSDEERSLVSTTATSATSTTGDARGTAPPPPQQAPPQPCIIDHLVAAIDDQVQSAARTEIDLLESSANFFSYSQPTYHVHRVLELRLFQQRLEARCLAQCLSPHHDGRDTSARRLERMNDILIEAASAARASKVDKRSRKTAAFECASTRHSQRSHSHLERSLLCHIASTILSDHASLSAVFPREATHRRGVTAGKPTGTELSSQQLMRMLAHLGTLPNASLDPLIGMSPQSALLIMRMIVALEHKVPATDASADPATTTATTAPQAQLNAKSQLDAYLASHGHYVRALLSFLRFLDASSPSSSASGEALDSSTAVCHSLDELHAELETRARDALSPRRLRLSRFLFAPAIATIACSERGAAMLLFELARILDSVAFQQSPHFSAATATLPAAHATIASPSSPNNNNTPSPGSLAWSFFASPPSAQRAASSTDEQMAAFSIAPPSAFVDQVLTDSHHQPPASIRALRFTKHLAPHSFASFYLMILELCRTVSSTSSTTATTTTTLITDLRALLNILPTLLSNYNATSGSASSAAISSAYIAARNHSAAVEQLPQVQRSHASETLWMLLEHTLVAQSPPPQAHQPHIVDCVLWLLDRISNSFNSPLQANSMLPVPTSVLTRIPTIMRLMELLHSRDPDVSSSATTPVLHMLWHQVTATLERINRDERAGQSRHAALSTDDYHRLYVEVFESLLRMLEHTTHSPSSGDTLVADGARDELLSSWLRFVLALLLLQHNPLLQQQQQQQHPPPLVALLDTGALKRWKLEPLTLPQRGSLDICVLLGATTGCVSMWRVFTILLRAIVGADIVALDSGMQQCTSTSTSTSRASPCLGTLTTSTARQTMLSDWLGCLVVVCERSRRVQATWLQVPIEARARQFDLQRHVRELVSSLNVCYHASNTASTSVVINKCLHYIGAVVPYPLPLRLLLGSSIDSAFVQPTAPSILQVLESILVPSASTRTEAELETIRYNASLALLIVIQSALADDECASVVIAFINSRDLVRKLLRSMSNAPTAAPGSSAAHPRSVKVAANCLDILRELTSYNAALQSKHLSYRPTPSSASPVSPPSQAHTGIVGSAAGGASGAVTGHEMIDLDGLFEAGTDNLLAVLSCDLAFSARLFAYEDALTIATALLLAHVQPLVRVRTPLAYVLVDIVACMLLTLASPTSGTSSNSSASASAASTSTRPIEEATLRQLASIPQYLAQINSIWRSKLIEKGVAGKLQDVAHRYSAHISSQVKEYCLQVVGGICRRPQQ